LTVTEPPVPRQAKKSAYPCRTGTEKALAPLPVTGPTTVAYGVLPTRMGFPGTGWNEFE
jgi:hypothetical protein